MKTVIGFLTALQQNNDRDWFTANKIHYQEAKDTFESFINRLIQGIHKFDPEIGSVTARECVFRIYRDVRFSKNKSPYKTNMGGFIAKGGRKGGNAGYYLHIDPEQSFIAGGNHLPPPDALKKIRQEILYNIGEFKTILGKPSFRALYGELDGERLSRPPKDFPADFPDIDLLKFKTYTVLHAVDESKVLAPDFEGYVLNAFRELHPLNRFLNKALA